MIALVFCGDIKYCPYINRYIERIESIDVDYRVYFWNRSKFELSLSDRYVYFDESSDLSSGKFSKFWGFIRFRKWLIKQLKDNHHDKIIALSTLTGVFLGSFLYNKKNSYLFDIRDYSYEHIPPFYYIEKKVIKNSFFTAISSAGFREFLPEHDYIIAHNFNRNDIIPNKTFEKKQGRINIVWNGLVRYFDFQKLYLDALKNDPRFSIIYHGDGPELSLYKEYCSSNEFTNVIFTGSYNNSEKARLLQDAHILNNCYGYLHGAGNKLKFAVSNKFYDGIIFHIPQLIEPDGYKTKWAKKAGIGISLKPDKEFADKLFDYYESIDSELFDNACETELKKVIAEDDQYISLIDAFITK